MKSGTDSWLSATALAAAAAGLGRALQIANGNLEPTAILWLTATIALCVLAVAAIRVPLFERLGDRLAVLILGVGLATQIGIHLTTAPGVYLRVGGEAYIEHHYWIAAAAVLAGASLSKAPWLGRIAFPLLLVSYFMLGLWLLKASPNPSIDVFYWHREAFSGLKHGIDPYAMTMPNIYGRTDWYGPGLASATQVDVGYPYPPLSLLLAAPGQLIAGDYRYSNLVAVTLSGGLIGYSRPGRLAKAAAALFLLTPRGFFVLEQGWTEVNVVLMLAATVFVACRAPRFLPYAFGLLIAVKQYLIFTAPLAFFFLPKPLNWRETARFFGKAAAVAAALTVPLFLWNPSAFFKSVVAFQGKQPFRADALSYVAWSAKDGLPVLPLWLSFPMAMVAIGIALWRSPRTPAGFAASSSLVFLLFFAFAKQAFCNYYFMIVGAFCCAAAALMPGVSPPSALGPAVSASPAAKGDASAPPRPS